MQGTLFSQRRPNYVNYGSYGSLVGFPIASALLQESHRLNDLESLSQFWDPTTQDTISNNKTKRHTANSQTVSALSKSKTYADLIAVKAAYSAYRDWAKRHSDEMDLPFLKLTPLQTFWVAVAQNHCLKVDEKGKIRIYGIIDLTTFRAGQIYAENTAALRLKNYCL